MNRKEKLTWQAFMILWSFMIGMFFAGACTSAMVNGEDYFLALTGVSSIVFYIVFAVTNKIINKFSR